MTTHNEKEGTVPLLRDDTKTALYHSEVPPSKRRSIYQSPFWPLTITTLSIFCTEAIIMVCFAFFLPGDTPNWIRISIDAVALVVFISPIIYFFVFRPLSLNIVERKRKGEEIRLLLTMTQVISGHHDLRDALKVALRRICETMGWILGEAWVPSSDGKCLELNTSWCSDDEGLAGFITRSRTFTFLPGIGLPGRVWFFRKPIFVKNVTVDRTFLRAELAREYGIKGAISLPVLLDNGEAFAIVNFFSRRILTEKDEQMVSHVTLQLGTLIQRKFADDAVQNAIRELERRNFEIRTLGEMSDKLQVCNTTQEFCTVIAQSIRLLFPAGALFICDTSRNSLSPEAVWGNIAMVEGPISSEGCYAIRFGRPHLVLDIKADLCCQHVKKGADPYLCAPFMGQGEILGVLLVSSGPLAAWGDKNQIESKRLLAIDASERIGLAMANLKLRNTLHSLSIRDSLTGLFNRRYMEESLEREIYRAKRNGTNMGVIMLDVDHFKEFNDTFGHEAGDVILHEIGVFLQRCVRGSDVACRYGGEEFILILPETLLEIVCQRAEWLRMAVKDIRASYGQQTLGHISLSFGVAMFPEHGQTAESIVQAADSALYRAKAAGRDRVCVAE